MQVLPRKIFVLLNETIQFSNINGMSSRNFVNLNVAVVGGGKAAERLAMILAFSDHDVYVGVADEEYETAMEQFRFYDNIMVTSVENAAGLSEVVIIAAPNNEVREMAYFVDDVKSKVVIDYSSFAQSGIEEVDSLNAIKVITGSKQIVKCYAADAYKKFTSPMLGRENIGILMVGDDKKSKVIAKIVLENLGFAQCTDFGTSEALKLLETITTKDILAPAPQKELVPVAVER